VIELRRMRRAEWAAYFQAVFSIVAYVVFAAEDSDILAPLFYLTMGIAHAALGYGVGRRRSETAAGILCLLQVVGFAWDVAAGAVPRMPLVVAIFVWIYGQAFVAARTFRRSSWTHV